MSIRRPAAALGALALGLIALTACDKPTDEATVTVGGRSVQAEAIDHCYDGGKELKQQVWIACLQTKPTHHITVGVGDKVRIGVAPSIGDKGWMVVRDGTPVTTELLKDKTYWTIDSAQLFTVQDPQTGQTSIAPSVTLNIMETTDTSATHTFRVIQFTLKRGK